MSNTRVAGKRGCLPPLPPEMRLPVKYIHEYTGPLPAPTYPVDVTGGIAKDSWGMCANGPDPTCTSHPKGLGDCTFAGREHYHYAKAACYRLTETRETSDQLAAEYLKYDHGVDQGAVIAKLLLHWYRAGLIAGFAPVDFHDVATSDSAMQKFKGLYTGVSLTDDADQLFGEGKPWTVADGQVPDPDEGHCILRVTADGTDLDGYVTWGALQPATRAWSASCVTEAWVIIAHEDEIEPAALAELQADLDQLGGGQYRQHVRRSHILSLFADLVKDVTANHRPASDLAEFAARHRL